MLRYAIGLVAVLTIFSSCTTELSLTGDYVERPLVYGLLDPNNNPNSRPYYEIDEPGDGHFFRIQKAFLGEESAFIMAMSPDSSYFKYEDLFVELVEYNPDNGNEIQRWALDTVMIHNKDTGIADDGIIDFFGPEQRLYKTKTDGSPTENVNIDPTLEYEITLKKRPASIGTMTISNMDTVTPIADSKVDVVDPSSFRWNTPSKVSQDNGTAPKMDLFNTSGEFKNYTIRFDAIDRAKHYEVWMRFHYREVISSVETEKSIEWKVSSFELDPNTSDYQVQLTSEAIYSRIGTMVQPEPNVIRYIGLQDGSAGDLTPLDGFSQDFDFYIRVAGDELFEYIDINNPTNSGALQDKPVYTNINNGLGVFSSRSSVEFTGMAITSSASLQLVDGEYTTGLGFVEDD